MSKSPGSTRQNTKRQAMRDRRRQKQQRQRLFIILIVIGAALIIAAILIVPSLLPAGDIVSIDPVDRPMADGRMLGDPNAPVIMEVYEDFQCPSCRSYSEDIGPQVVDTYVATGQVYYIFRHFPFLDDNAPRNESDQAANASMCAAEQDRFWDYHDLLFANWNGENAGAFIDRRLVAFADELGLDMAAFNACFAENLYQSEIEADLEMGASLNVTGTPAVFVNGQILTPGFVPTFAEISEAVDAALNSSENPDQ
jgi:protein-disulfide isomerase